MKFFIDTANIKEISEANDLGIIDGVTTNPSLISKEGRDFKDLVREICDIVDGPISVEAVSTEAKAMVSEARGLSKIHKNVVVKIPICGEGLRAIKILSKEGIRINTTLIFSPSQALLAAKAGAAYVSPFVGRLDDISHVGMDLVGQIITIFGNYNLDTEVIVASIRNPIHLVDAAMAGADIATIPFNVIQQLLKHPLTDIGIKKFLEDWEKVPRKG